MARTGQELKISDVSRLSGVPVSTLRVWGERGLLNPAISPSGYRIYNEDHIRRALDIKRLRTIQGLSITAIKAALNQAVEPVFVEPTGREPPTDAQAADPISGAIGGKLRALRRASNLTIREVAERVGISASALASIERTSLGVRIPEAKALADFYGVTLTSLMADPLSEFNKEVTTTSGGGQILPTLGKGLRIEQLATGREMMDCQRWFIEPGVDSHGAYSHDGEEFVYVLLGEFEITIETQRAHHLRQGESIYFKSNWKHSWRNPGNTICVLLWVNTPPSF